MALTPIRESIEKHATQDLRDVFLCHAWDDRNGPAKELHDMLVSRGVKVWFSETDVGLGVSLMRAIDRGLANSRVGVVLVPPALLASLPREGIADRELAALLRRERLRFGDANACPRSAAGGVDGLLLTRWFGNVQMN